MLNRCSNYDEHGPAGPTAFWKMGDPRPQDEEDGTIVLHDFLTVIEGLVDYEDEEFDGDYVMGEYGEDDEEDDMDDVDEAEAMREDLEALARAEDDVEIIDLLGPQPGPVSGQQNGQGQ